MASAHGNIDDSDEADEDFNPAEDSEEEAPEEPASKKRKVELADDNDDFFAQMVAEAAPKKTTPASVQAKTTIQKEITPKPPPTISSKTPPTTKLKEVLTPGSLELELSLEQPKKEVELETLNFAGETITVTKERAAALGRTSLKKKPSGGDELDSILGNLKPQKKISTMQKTQLDWEKLKKEQNIEDELKEQTKDGYLAKQQFLLQVDHNTFHKEKEVRNRDYVTRNRK